MKKLIIVTFIILDIILLAIMSYYIRDPIYNKYSFMNGKTPDGKTKFYQCKFKSTMTSEKIELLKYGLDIDKLLNNEYINWDDELEVEIKTDFRHRRTHAYLSIYGNYSSNEDLIKILKEFNVNVNENQIYANNSFNIIINNEQDIQAYIDILDNNVIIFSTSTLLPYRYYVNDIDSAKPNLQYYMKISEEIRKEARIETIKANIKLIYLYVIVNIICIIIIYLLFKIIKKRKK